MCWLITLKHLNQLLEKIEGDKKLFQPKDQFWILQNRMDYKVCTVYGEKTSNTTSAMLA